MVHITITTSPDGQRAHQTPDAGCLLQRGLDAHLYPEADVKNKPTELRKWKAVEV